MRQLTASLLDLLYPRRCAVCGRTLEKEERCLCEDCLKDIPLTYFWSWRENPAEKILWGRCRFETVSSLFYYHRESAYSVLTPKVKYGGDRRLGRYLGRMLGHHLNGHIPAVDYVVPVPIHPLKKWRRGYNQAEIITAGVMEGLTEGMMDGMTDGMMGGVMEGCEGEGPGVSGRGPVLAADVLVRRRWSRSQTIMDVGNKWENVRGAFKLKWENARKLEGMHVLLIDDVLTTGATAESCWDVISLVPGIKVSFATLGFVE